jgi:hypothetical protein
MWLKAALTLGLFLGALSLCTAGAPAKAASAAALPSLVLYVSPTGNDTWSGTLADPNANRTDGPFATLLRARDEIRKRKAAGQFTDGAAVLVRGGEYELTTAFVLLAEDSGTATAPIIYQAFPGEKPVLYGGRKVQGFQPYQGQIVQADTASQGFAGVVFRQLYCNGRRQERARYPNVDPARPRTGGWAFVDGTPLSMYQEPPTGATKRQILVRRNDLRTWAHPEDGEVNIYPRYNWSNDFVPIASCDRDQRTITLAQDASNEIRPLDRYCVQGLFEELDAPGEWFLDRRTGTLYFWPPEPIDSAVVRAPLAENVILIISAQYLTIQGFTVECCEGSAVLLRNTTNCLVAANTISNIGGRCDDNAGVRIENGTGNRVFGNDIHDIAGYGIVFLGGDLTTLVPSGHSAENNYIHHIGLLNGHGCGVLLTGVGNRVAHNLIHDTARCGIYTSGNDQVIEFNRIRNVNLDTEDTGGIYSGAGQEGWMRRGLIVRYNFLTDTLGFGRDTGKWVCPYYSWGIYLDDACCEATVYGNIVARTANGGAIIHGGRDHVIENNIFVDGQTRQMTWFGSKPPDTLEPDERARYLLYKDNTAYLQHYPKFAALNPDTDGPMGDNSVLHNILCYRNPQAPLYMTLNYLADQNECDANLIWHYGQPLLVQCMGTPAAVWDNWRSQGSDVHSIVADPLFVDPDQDDYRLQENSPASQIGFQTIPVDQIGPYADPLRASWPIIEAPGARESPFASESPAPILVSPPVLSRDWVYQNTPVATQNRHAVLLTVAALTMLPENLVTITVTTDRASVGRVTITKLSETTFEIKGGQRQADGLAGTGVVTLNVHAQDVVGNADDMTVNLVVRRLGDTTGDGFVTSADRVELLKRLNGQQPATLSDEAADIDGDGQITASDLVLLNKILNNQVIN